MAELHWKREMLQHHLMEGQAVRAKVWHSMLYGWCVYCLARPPAQLGDVKTLEEAKALAVALVKLD